jgi:serine/threonine protein kinase
LEAKDSYGIMKKLNIAISKKYEVVEMVGNGSYGTVMKAKDKKTDTLVALKVMKS